MISCACPACWSPDRHLIGIETTENLQIIASVPEPGRTGVQRMAAIMSEGVPGPVMPVVRPTSTRLARIVAPRAW